VCASNMTQWYTFTKDKITLMRIKKSPYSCL
jgi:hypothetical protein